jgi:hypothetical protein
MYVHRSMSIKCLLFIRNSTRSKTKEPLWLSGKVMEWENEWNQKTPGLHPSPGNLLYNTCVHTCVKRTEVHNYLFILMYITVRIILSPNSNFLGAEILIATTLTPGLHPSPAVEPGQVERHQLRLACQHRPPVYQLTMCEKVESSSKCELHLFSCWSPLSVRCM